MIHELRTFLAVARDGTFSGAGANIGLTQSAVSSQIKRLEEHFGYHLFDRTGRSAQLNDAGRALIAPVEALLKQFAALGQEDPHSLPPELLRIGAIASAQSGLLLQALAPFRMQRTRTKLHIVPGTSMELMDQLDAGSLDAALIIRPPFGIYSQLVWQPLLHEPYMLLTHGSVQNLGWRELLKTQPFIRYDRHSFGGRMVERFLRRHQIRVDESIELDDLPTLIELVARGDGVAIAPMADALLPLPECIQAITLGEDTFYREIGILSQRLGKASPAVVALTHCLQQAAESSEKRPLFGV